MALNIPHSIFHLARLLYVRPENFGLYYVSTLILLSYSSRLHLSDLLYILYDELAMANIQAETRLKTPESSYSGISPACERQAK